MAKTIYELLGIPPTDDLSIVKRAYRKQAVKLHPDHFQSSQYTDQIREEKNAQFVELSTEFTKVNSEEKLRRYFDFIQRPESERGAATFSEAPRSEDLFRSRKKHEPMAPDALRVPRHGFMSVFIPIEVYEKAGNENEQAPFLFLPKLKADIDNDKFASNFDFNNLASVLTNQLSRNIKQVGMTFNEAEQIINQHRHGFYIVIAEVQVPLDRLLDEKQSERDLMNPSVLNARTGDFLCLMKGTNFTKEDIVSVKPMQNYTNSLSFVGRSIKDLWPDGTLAIDNPRVPTSRRKPLGFFEEKAAAPLAVEAAPHVDVTNSCFNEKELAQIRAHIQRLTTEKNGSFTAKIKQEKIDGLTKLIELSKTTGKEEAISIVSKQFPRLRSGIFSTRTHDLLNDFETISSKKTNKN